MTKTLTIKKTVQPAHVHRRHVEAEYSESESPIESNIDAEAVEVIELDARQVSSKHLCPVCPANVHVGAAKNNGGDATFCCPKRKTVTMKSTKTKRVTRTVTAGPVGLHWGPIKGVIGD